MKTKITIITALVAVMGLLFAGCSGDTHHDSMDGQMNHEGMQGQNHMNRETKSLELAGAKVTVDWMSMGQHHQMMQGMNMKGHDMEMKDSDRHIMLTLTDLKSNEQIREAEIEISVTGPSGEEIPLSHATMSNESMHHEGYSFAVAGKGDYSARITLKRGERSETGQVSLELK